MSRSVSTHSNAVVTVYLNPVFTAFHFTDDHWDESKIGGYYDFDDFLDDVSGVVRERFPSFESCNRWVARETHVILENRLAEVSVSEYGGLVAVCLAPLDSSNGASRAALNSNWAHQIARGFHRHLSERFESFALSSNGFASNGEQFFTRAGRPGSCFTSKEGDLFP